MPRLQLTNDEYDALYILLMNIGGDPVHSKRRHVESITQQMRVRYSKISRVRHPRRGNSTNVSTSFDKNFYMVAGERMYWKNDDGTPAYVFKDNK